MSNMIEEYLEKIRIISLDKGLTQAEKNLSTETIRITFDIDLPHNFKEFDSINYHNEKNIINDMLLLAGMKKILNYGIMSEYNERQTMLNKL